MSLVAGLLILGLGWWALRSFARANPKTVVGLVKRVGGAAALLLAGLMLVRGRMDMAMLAAGAGAWLFGWSWFPLPAWARRPGSVTRGGGTSSTVRSRRVEMRLDHDSGALGGIVLEGAAAGRRLDDLALGDLLAVRRACLGDDPDGARLLETYLDRRFAGWREHAEPDGHPGTRADSKRGPMTVEEAHEVLGLKAGAGADEIRRAHRELMKKLHPDQGGTNDLASRVNQAKDLLLNRHR